MSGRSSVGIDYSLFLVTRHRTQLREGVEMHESIARAVGTAGTAVVFAGCTVVVALVSLVVAGIPLVSALGYTAAVAVATAVLAAITLLPALMSLAGRFINSIALTARLHPSEDPEKVGLWGHWSNFVTGRPWVAAAIAAVILVPLIIPVFTLHLGQENIGQTSPSTMERKAYDLMASGFGPGYNGPLTVAVALVPSATASKTVTAQEKQATDLQNQLKAEQKQGNQMEAELKSGQASLEQQQAVLERQQAALNQQAADLQRQQNALEAQQASLEAQQASLQSQASQLQAERDQLEAQARALAARVEKDARHLVGIKAAERRVEHAIATTTDPVRLAHLQARLAQLQADEKRTIADLKASKKEAKALEAKARKLKRQAAALEAQKVQLEAQGAQLQSQAAALQSQAAVLQQQADALQKQGDSLQAQAAALQQQKADLDALQAKAARQQKQATQLQNELTKTLTKAGGDDRGTDPRLVDLQDALINTKGDELVAPPQISKHGDDVVYTVIATTAPSATATADLVRLLRDKVIPNHSDKGVTAYVGGSTAGNVDLASAIASRLPLVIVTILLFSMLVLLVAFRSVHDSDPGGGHQLPDRDGGVRDRDRGVPVGLGNQPGRDRHHRVHRPHRKLRPADDVRCAVWPQHGLPGVPAVIRGPFPGARRERSPVGAARPEGERARDRGGGTDHDVGVLELHPQRRPGGQTVWRGARERRRAGRHDGADAGARAVDDHGQVGVVDAEPAGQDRAQDRHRRREPRRTRSRNTSR